MPDLFDKRNEIIEFIINLGNQYTNALFDPQQFLTPGIPPTTVQIADGLEFYLTILFICFVLTIPIVFTFKGGFQDKVKLLTLVVYSLITSGIIALAFHFPFWLFGGQGSFAESFLAMAYSTSPYSLIITLSTMVLFAGIPRHLWPQCLSPATQQQAFKLALADPNTSLMIFYTSSIVITITLFWNVVVVLKNLSFAHNIHGWKFAGAIGVCLVLLAVIQKVNQVITLSILNPVEHQNSI